MAETDSHLTVIIHLIQALRDFFESAPNVYVAGDMMFYYAEGHKELVKVPDVFVVKGVLKHKRRTFKLWEERAVPCTIFEITSKGTRKEDTDGKKKLYQQLGVQEYFLFDPLDEYLEPRLQGFTLVNGRYKKLKPVAKDTLLSSELGLLLRAEDDILRLVNATTGKVIPNSREAMRYAEFETYLADFEAQRADSETRRADVAEANAMRLQAEVEAKATQLQAEIARLQAELVRLRGQK
jgi:Uma2 family endonuclease/uncharacterized small protein (DUF1192 family)